MFWEKPDRTEDLWEVEGIIRIAESVKDYNTAITKLEKIYYDYKGIYRRFYVKPYVLYLMGCAYAKLAETSFDNSYYQKAIDKFNLSIDYLKLKKYENRDARLYLHYDWTINDSINLDYTKRELTAMNYGQRAYVEMKLQNYDNAISDIKYFFNNIPIDERDYHYYLKYYNFNYEYKWREANQLLFDKNPYYYLALMQYYKNDYDRSLESIKYIFTMFDYEENDEEYFKYDHAREFFGEVFLLKGKIQIQKKELYLACKYFKYALHLGIVEVVDLMKKNNCK